MNAALYKPTDLTAPGGITALLAFHKARFGDARMEAEDGSDEGSSDEGEGKVTGATSSGDKGFPDGTPLEQMTAEQQANYWKHQSRKHEERSKAFGNLSPDALRALQEKANKHDELERELMSDKDRAIVEAREAALKEATPRVVRAEFKAAAKGVLTSEQLAALLEDRDLSKYVDANGDPDEEKISKLVTAFAPKQDEQGQRRRGPSPVGAGARGSSSGPSLSAGSDAYARRHGKK